MNSRPSPLRRALAAAFCFILLLFNSRAADTPPAAADLRTLLRDALFEEEATRDLDKAAAGYEALLTKWAEQRQFAAAALYRLAEVRRKQGRKDDAIKLYQRLVTEFADQDPHARLSRENLTALGVKEPAPGNAPSAAPAVSDEEAAALARVQKLAVDSPDLLTGKEFTIACEEGWLSVVKFLRGKGVKDSQDGIQAAAKSGHLAVCAELLTQPYTPQALRPAMKWAVMNNRSAVLRLLLEKGADPEVPPGTVPLLTASILLGNHDSTALLLQNKSAVLPANATTTPQFAAAKRANGDILQRLLDLGADATAGGSSPNTRDLTVSPGNSKPGAPNSADPLREVPGSTPLHAAAAGGSAECVSLLLKANADPNATNDDGWTPIHGAAKEGDAAIIELLLAAGAKADSDWKSAEGKALLTPLMFAAIKGEVSSVTALLKATADINREAEGTTAIGYAMNLRDTRVRDEIVNLLLAHGANPAAGGRSAIDYAPPPVKIKLLRDYQYPKLTAKPDITLVFGDEARESLLATRTSPDEKPGTLPALLLAWHDKGGWNHETTGMLQRIPDWSALRLFRKGDDGKMTETLLPIKAGADFPAILWGDIIEIISKDWNTPPPPQPRRYPGSFDPALRSDVLAILRGTQTVHVTFKTGDFTRDLTLRGILRVYDPTTTEAPLISTWKLVALIAGDNPGRVKVERSAARGGGVIEWGMRAESGLALPEEGDIITFTPDPEPDLRRVALRIPGHPGRWANIGDDQQPTLFQFLADFYGPLPFFQVLPSAANNPGTSRAAALKALTPDDLLANLISNGAPVSTRPYLPWPDWSSVKIHRRVKNPGEPETMNLLADIDLLAAIAALPADALPEDARKLDILLNPGDEIELPLLKDHPAAPWTGFDEATARAFRKALLANVTLSDDTGRFRRVTLQWLPPRWVPTPAGVLPIPDGDATDGRVHWLRARDLADSAAPGFQVKRTSRDGQFLFSDDREANAEVFLRHGDTLLLAPASSRRVNNTPVQQPPVGTPQPSVPVPQ